MALFQKGDQIRLNREGIKTYGDDAPVAKYTATVLECRKRPDGTQVVILTWNETGTGHSQSYDACLFKKVT